MLIFLVVIIFGAVIIYFLFNFRTILSALAGMLFFIALIGIPPLLAGSNLWLQFLIFFGIILIVYMSVGKDIFKSKLLNFLMGVALLIAICVNFFQFCRKGW